MIEFVVASHNEDVLNKNLKASPIFRMCNLIVQTGYINIPKAYNEAVIYWEYCLSSKPIVVYIHHDVYLPETFGPELLKSLKEVPVDWEVLGVAGALLSDGKKFIRGHILDRGKEWGGSTSYFNPVDTLDDMLLITRGNIKFDEQFEQDFYGPDICIGRKCYAIKAFCHHNSSRKIGERTESFYRSQELFRIKHADSLPIACTYAMIEKEKV